MSDAKEISAASSDAPVDSLPDPDVKIILLGDSAVGKSKLVERFLMDEYNPRQLSTYALTLFRKDVKLEDDGGATTVVDFWDTAGQESFNRMHPSYYYRAHCCILVFDVTRKVTYQHLSDWYKELREYCEHIPCILVANKIDVDYNVTRKEFKFASKHDLPFFFVSAADGTNVVKVFQSAVLEAKRFKISGGTWVRA
jgi:Rab-like protein 2